MLTDNWAQGAIPQIVSRSDSFICDNIEEKDLFVISIIMIYYMLFYLLVCKLNTFRNFLTSKFLLLGLDIMVF